MQFLYAELVSRFQEVLGTPKELIEETYNKPDATDVARNKYISVKNFGEFYILIVFETYDNYVRFLNAYRIYPKLMDGADMSRMKPIEVLKEFMDRYGVAKTIPGFGERNILLEKNTDVFFLGVLNVEKYLEAIKNI